MACCEAAERLAAALAAAGRSGLPLALMPSRLGVDFGAWAACYKNDPSRMRASPIPAAVIQRFGIT
jgi:hypothetical protein